MLSESQFVQCEKIAHQTMPSLKAQLDGLDSDYLHKGFDLAGLKQLAEPLLPQHAIDYSQTILDRVLDKLCVQDIPGKRGSFLPTYLAIHDREHRANWELAAEERRQKSLKKL